MVAKPRTPIMGLVLFGILIWPRSVVLRTCDNYNETRRPYFQNCCLGVLVSVAGTVGRVQTERNPTEGCGNS